MDITTWGECIFSSDYSQAIIKDSSDSNYRVTIFNNCFLIDYFYKGQIKYRFVDEPIDNKDLNTFKRVIEGNIPYDQIYIYKDNKIVLATKQKKVSYMKNTKQVYKKSDKFITMDLETFVLNGEMKTYCVSLYDGKEMKTFYLTDYKDSDELMETSIEYLMKRKYNGYKIYIHNLSYFDGVLLLRILM